MKWLQWSTVDLEQDLGGVETHARGLARELKRLGVEAVLSRDPTILSQDWDVIHTHGSGFPLATHWRSHLSQRRQKKKPIWVHTLHGWSLERMWACREFFWPGGYKAWALELAAISDADVILSVHDKLKGFGVLKNLKKNVSVCSNGWDSFEGITGFCEPQDHWIYVGRASDRVKGAGNILDLLKMNPRLKIVAVPGEGFPDHKQIIKTGRLTPDEVGAGINKSRGLILSSLYEGLPLVVLEALAQGVPVVSTCVGGLQTLNPDLEGLAFSKEVSAQSLNEALVSAEKFPSGAESRRTRALSNRKYLKTWRQVAETSLFAVQRALSQRLKP